MIGLDTNVLVRDIMQDTPDQAAKAAGLIEGLTADMPGFVSLVCLVELNWVLSSAYGLSRDQVAQALDTLLRTKEIVVDRADIALRAVSQFKSSKADFADCLIERIGADAGCQHTVTFDIGAAKHAGMVLID
jgi:predicted nucleic-acid-binding protein